MLSNNITTRWVMMSDATIQGTIPMAASANTLDAWLKEQAKKLKNIEASGHRLKLDFVENARDKGEILIDVRKHLAETSETFEMWVTENTGIGYSTAQLYMDVARNFKTVKERFAHSNGLEVTLRQVRDAIRDARQERGEGKPGSGRKPTNGKPPTPDLGTLGTLEIGPGGVVATAQADAFQSVSTVDRKRKLLVCRGWDTRARDALARGIAVLLLPELQEECRP